MKKVVAIGLSLMIMVLSSGLVVNASEIPSEWAVDEVELAINGGLVPDLLRVDYQKTVKRYEYVLLALEILEEANEKTVIKYAFPFNDIEGHAYEDQIVRAYNSGIINGYEDGSFKPDVEISRQEIATLVVNLVRVLAPEREVTQAIGYTYSDSDQIGQWAVENVDYCYANGIIKGIGRDLMLLDIIDPLGLTTREQAVVLIYRLAVDEDLYKANKYSNVLVGDGSEDGYFVTEMLDEFAKENSYEIADAVYDMQNKSYIDLIYITENVVELKHVDGSFITIYNENFFELSLRLKDPENLVMVNALNDLIELYLPEADLSETTKRAAREFSKGNLEYYYKDYLMDEQYMLYINDDSYSGSEEEEGIDVGYAFKLIEVDE